MIAQHLSHATYGSSGSASPAHLAGALLAPTTGVTLTMFRIAARAWR
jgi:hypothetical protein